VITALQGAPLALESAVRDSVVQRRWSREAPPKTYSDWPGKGTRSAADRQARLKEPT